MSLHAIARRRLGLSAIYFWGGTLENEPILEDELEGIEELCLAATSGPWFVRALDDDYAMNLVAVRVVPDTGRSERWPNYDHRDIVAATFVQHPRYVDSADGKWDENAAFIAMARSIVPRLVSEVRRLRGITASQNPPHGPKGTAGR